VKVESQNASITNDEESAALVKSVKAQIGQKALITSSVGSSNGNRGRPGVPLHNEIAITHWSASFVMDQHIF